MRIVVNDIAASCGGAMTILKQFYDYVKHNDTKNEWVFLLGDKYLEETDRIKIRCFPDVKKSRIKKVLFDCFYGKRVIHSFDPDVVVSLQNIITFGVKKTQILYVHQSIPFQKEKNFSFLKKEERSLAVIQHIVGIFIKASVKRADKVFVQTKWIQKAVAEKCGKKEEDIHLAFPTVETFEPDVSKFDHTRFFYPTSNQLYKNNDVILRACDELNAMGIHDFLVDLTLPEGTIVQKNIRCVGYLSREQMIDEYQSCALLFPSYIETVGLPLLEARSCNTMILASDTAFAHECLDGYANAKFFAFFDSEELADEMKKIIEYPATPSVNTGLVIRDYPSWNAFYKEIMNVKDTVSDECSFSVSR